MVSYSPLFNIFFSSGVNILKCLNDSTSIPKILFSRNSLYVEVLCKSTFLPLFNISIFAGLDVLFSLLSYIILVTFIVLPFSDLNSNLIIP
jgi:hypothetical protein